MVENRSPLFLPLAIIIAIISVSTASLFIRFAQQEAPSLVIAALRLTIASLLLAPIAIIRHKKELLSLSKKELLLGLLSGFFLALHFATWITSLEYTSVASSVVLVSTGPLWVALLSPVFLHESLSKKVFWGMLLAVSGGFFIALSDSCVWQSKLICPSLSDLQNSKSMIGNLLALSGALTVTGYLIIGRRLRIQNIPNPLHLHGLQHGIDFLDRIYAYRKTISIWIPLSNIRLDLLIGTNSSNNWSFHL